MVGTLVEVGRGKRMPADMETVLAARSRAAAGKTAPAHGLYLVRVDYEGATSRRERIHEAEGRKPALLDP
jgi:tRNA U38,U39,U40 pseudouridine synthase TruA